MYELGGFLRQRYRGFLSETMNLNVSRYLLLNVLVKRVLLRVQL